MKELWLIVGSQHLYGEETLKEVRENSIKISESLSINTGYNIVFKGIVESKEKCRELFKEVEYNDKCIGVIVWAHTFSPSKMWIETIKKVTKPILHLSTQISRVIPYATIDMDYMNTNQSAHGDRELSYAFTYANVKRKIVVGYYEDEQTYSQIKEFAVVCHGIEHSNKLKMLRFGDNMNNVADTDGNKVYAEEQLGWTILTVGIGELVEYVDKVSEDEIDKLMNEYHELYNFGEGSDKVHNVRYQAKLEIALERILVDNECSAFTSNFNDLHNLEQLPGLAAQRLMAKGYGFAGEGDWKTSAMVNIVKTMTNNINTSFMEDYIYDFDSEIILQSHMLEICPTIAKDKPTIEVHPLSIGGKDDPARLKFVGKPANGFAACLVEMKGKLRMVISEVEVINAPADLPKLPVAATFWKLKPKFTDAIKCWMYAGGMHHTVYTSEISIDQMKQFCEYKNIECLIIDEHTNVEQFISQVGG